LVYNEPEIVTDVAGSDAGNKLWLSWLQRQMQD